MNLENQKKVDILKEFITDDDIFLCVDATNDGVIVPQNHKNNYDLRLVISLQFRNKPIFQDECIESVLLFGGVPRKCLVPYDAIWGVIQKEYKRLYFWQENMPPEILKKVQNSAGQVAEEEEVGDTPITREKVDEEASETASKAKKKKQFMVIENKKKEPETEETGTKKKRSRAHLKVLK